MKVIQKILALFKVRNKQVIFSWIEQSLKASAMIFVLSISFSFLLYINEVDGSCIMRNIIKDPKVCIQSRESKDVSMATALLLMKIIRGASNLGKEAFLNPFSANYPPPNITYAHNPTIKPIKI